MSETITRINKTFEPPNKEDLPEMTPGWLGYLAYDFAFEKESKLKSRRSPTTIPSAALGFYPWIGIIDPAKQTITIRYLEEFEEQATHIQALLSSPIECNPPDNYRLTAPFQPDISPDEYQQAFDQVQNYIQQGDCYQINLTQRFSTGFFGSPSAAFMALARQHSAPMACYFDIGKAQILSASPERFIQIRQRQAITRPIKGTRPRNADPATDLKLKQELALSGKDKAENVMIVDLLRNDLGRVSVTGSVQVDELCGIESFPNVHHMVSTISSQLKPELSHFDAVAQCFPGGSITGAPKLRAMQIIEELEAHRRDIYCGSFLYSSLTDYTDSNIMIRSFLVEQNHIYCWGGGGIVADSESISEYNESVAKIRRLMDILEENSARAQQPP